MNVSFENVVEVRERIVVIVVSGISESGARVRKMIPALVPCAIDCCRLIIELRDHWQWYTRHVVVSFSFFQPSVWSMVRRITLPPSYADWTNFSFIPLKYLTDHSHKDGELVSECETLGRASCLAMAGRVTLSRGTIFSHVNTSARRRVVLGTQD